MPPGVPELGETVAEDDERALALLGEVHGDAVGPDGAMLRADGRKEVAHRSLLWSEVAGSRAITPPHAAHEEW
jgi:hypothetical protein